MTAKAILLQFIGFLLQTLPIAVLYPVPFHDDALPLSRKKMTLLLSGYTVLLSAGFALMSWLIYVPRAEHNTFVRTASNMYMLICVILSIYLFFLTIRSPFMKKLIVIVVLIHYATALFTLSCIIIGALANNKGTGVLTIYGKYEPLTNIGLLAATFPFVYLFFKRQVRQSEDQLRSFDNQYRQISTCISEARRIRHDIRHHLNQISAMNHQGEQKALEEYLQSYEASFYELEQAPLCGYPAFDNILQYYIQCAREKGIIVKTELSPLRESLGFDVVDITVLLGNLMENAIEACCKLPSDIPPFIRIWVKQADAVFLLEVENSCENGMKDQSDFTDASHFASTKHAMSRGIGLKSIQFAAEKYGGNAEFKKSMGTFTARVVMNIP